MLLSGFGESLNARADGTDADLLEQGFAERLGGTAARVQLQHLAGARERGLEIVGLTKLAGFGEHAGGRARLQFEKRRLRIEQEIFNVLIAEIAIFLNGVMNGL